MHPACFTIDFLFCLCNVLYHCPPFVSRGHVRVSRVCSLKCNYKGFKASLIKCLSNTFYNTFYTVNG
jgi:hypothetical protein